MVPRRLRAISAALSAPVILLACTGDSFAGPDEAEEDPTPGVTSLAVKPDSVDLSPGETRQFTARGIDEAGDTVAVDAAWSATGGTVADDGTFTAGDSAGAFMVAAGLSSGPADTAAVRVRDEEAGDEGGTDSDGGDGASAAECDDPDPAWIWCDDFEHDRTDAYFAYDEADGDFVRADGVGLDASTGMRARFAEGQVSAGNLKLAMGRTPGSHFEPVDEGADDHRELYWRVWVRHEADWTGGGGNKFSRATIFHDDSWSQAMIAHVWSPASEPDRSYLALDPASGTDESGNVQTSGYNDFDDLRWLGAERGDTPIFDDEHVGEWYCVEVRVRLNDPGASDGVFEMWIDGALDARADGLDWVGSYDDYGINAVFVENYWNDGSTQAQERYFDQFVVSTERIGC